MENRRPGIPEMLLMKLAEQFDKFGGIITIDGITTPGKVGVLHLLKTTGRDGEQAIQMPPFQHEIIDIDKE